jgi:hypothetical protein
LTVLRRLHDVSYWVIDDPEELFDLVNVNIRREWESDAISEGKNPEESEWLRSLSARRWQLEIVDIDKIIPNQELMSYSDAKTGYNFAKRLQERSEGLRHEIEASGRIIPPVILRSEDNQLMDGYCRYSTLKNMGVKGIYAYVGYPQ